MLAEKRILESVESVAPLLRDIALEIHSNPELGLEEFNAARLQVELFRDWGFDVTAPFAGLKTAYKAKFGHGKPVFCFMAEYDALPGLGHACGHNLIATSAIGAGKALADVLQAEKFPGSVVVMGTPAEEGKGGKVRMISQNALDGIDAAIMAHPSDTTATWSGCMGVERFNVRFIGKAAHASKAPQDGRNALDAVMFLFQGINAWREHLPENTRIHGVITDGGTLPNIVPEFSAASFYIRAEHQKQIETMIKRFKNIVEGAALMTGCTFEVEHREFGYKSGVPNEILNRAFFEYSSTLGMDPKVLVSASRVSTDFGNVSREVPGVHVYFGIFDGEETHALHTVEFVKHAKSEYAINQAVTAAKAMALVGCRFFTDSEFRAEIAEEFSRQLKIK